MAVIDYTKENRIATITINRPEAMNSISLQTLKELHDALIDFRDDSAVWVAIITGAGERAFCAGADLKDLIPFMKDHRNELWRLPPTHMRGLDIYKPLIAAVNGLALGGGMEIALACDIRIAAENARFGQPEVNAGIIPGWGGTQRLTRMVTWCRAAELLLTGKPIDAQEAYRIGLVNKVVPLNDLMTTAREWAQMLCQPGPLAVRAAKEAMIKGSGVPLDEGLWIENSLFAAMLGTEDLNEGISAFAQKRKPNFKAK